ncbi:hypothetical protein [Microvirga vignae]|nr:hypothetical protein [Microvirga vignae]
MERKVEERRKAEEARLIEERRLEEERQAVLRLARTMEKRRLCGPAFENYNVAQVQWHEWKRTSIQAWELFLDGDLVRNAWRGIGYIQEVEGNNLRVVWRDGTTVLGHFSAFERLLPIPVGYWVIDEEHGEGEVAEQNGYDLTIEFIDRERRTVNNYRAVPLGGYLPFQEDA